MRSRKSRFLSIITIIGVLGIALGVMKLTIVLSVTGGFQSSFQERILGLHPHLLVWPPDDQFVDYREAAAALQKDPRVLGSTPATYDEMMIAHNDRRAGAVIKGVDMPTVDQVLDLEPLMTEGSLEPLNEWPTARFEGNSIQIENLVEETSWTAVLWGSDRLLFCPNDLAEPLPDMSWITVVHVAENEGPLDVVLATLGEPTMQTVVPGETTRPIALPAGSATLALNEVSLLEDAPTLDSGQSYLLLIAPGPTATLLRQPAHRPPEGEARVRFIDARATKQPLVSAHSGEQMIPPGETAQVPGRRPAILLGSALAERIAVSVGDEVTVSSPHRGLGSHGLAPMGMEPTSGRFEVKGLFESGYYDYDKRFALVSFDAARRFLNMGDRAKWLEVKVDDPLAVDSRKQVVQDILQPYSAATFTENVSQANARVQAALAGEISQFDIEENPDSMLSMLRNAAQITTLLRTTLPHTFTKESRYKVITYAEVNRPLFQALKLQKLVLSVFFLIIIVVAAFNIVGTQIMMVHQKTREIAILKALGSTRWMVRKVFLIQGLIVSLFGTGIGLFLGLGSCFVLDRIGYPLEPEVYLINELPVRIDMIEIGAVVGCALLLTFMATLYSSNRAGRLMPVDGIRYIE